MSAWSTKVTSIPKRGQAPAKSPFDEVYSDRAATTWSPAEHSASTVAVIAPMPLAKAWAPGAPSSSATASSKAATVGFP